MQTQEKVMALRMQAGLKITIIDMKGNPCTIYPKDEASKQQWICRLTKLQKTFVIE